MKKKEDIRHPAWRTKGFHLEAWKAHRDGTYKLSHDLDNENGVMVDVMLDEISDVLYVIVGTNNKESIYLSLSIRKLSGK